MVKKGKSNYTFPANANSEQIIKDWLTANGFRPVQDETGKTIYENSNAMVGNCYFEYSINGGQLVIVAYFGSIKNPYDLSDGLMGSLTMIVNQYRDQLSMLFSALNESATTSAPVVAAPATNGVPAASQAFATPGQPNMMTSNVDSLASMTI